MRKIVVGSRKSKLALTQTQWVIDQLKQYDVPFEFEIKKIVTKGDRILDVTLSKVGGKGLFVKEIEQAMYDQEIDFAVHSMKDVPSELPDGLVIGCTPKRVDYRDAFISKGGMKLADLPQGAIVGTSSLRRSAQLLKKRPDLTIKPIRGNIDTRLEKLEQEDFDAIVLAAAGLKRMGWSDDVVTEYLEPEAVLPAVGQGALAIECRENDSEVRELLRKLNDEYTEKTTKAERAFLYKIEGGCQIPVAAHATLVDERISVTALVASPDGKTILKETVTGVDPEETGYRVAELLIDRGAAELVQEAKEESDK